MGKAEDFAIKFMSVALHNDSAAGAGSEWLSITRTGGCAATSQTTQRPADAVTRELTKLQTCPAAWDHLRDVPSLTGRTPAALPAAGAPLGCGAPGAQG